MTLKVTRRSALALPLIIPVAARPQSWRPGQQVRIVVGAAAGGTTDIMARLVAQHLQARFGPAGLPLEITTSLNAEVNAWLDLADTKRRFEELGGVPLKVTPREFDAFIASEITKWQAVIQKEGLQLDAS